MTKKIWNWIEHNRFLTIGPILVTLLWIYAVSCTPVTPDPLKPTRAVNARQLQNSFEIWKTQQQLVAQQFEYAGQDLKEQQENNNKIQKLIMNIAAANVTDLPGLLQLLLAGGGLGAIADNIRKRSLISGLKYDKKSS